MEDTVETTQTGSVNFAVVRIRLDFARAGCPPDQATDLVITFSHVAGHGDPTIPLEPAIRIFKFFSLLGAYATYGQIPRLDPGRDC